MAFHHAALFLTLLFLWFVLISAQAHREPKLPKSRSQQERLTRGAQFNFNDLQLNTARGYGKRAVDMHHVNNFLLEWIALENKMRNIGISRNPLRDEETIPE